MYEEDRQTALSMYERMFDETADEQGLLQLLVSPTRQAVVLARSYDAKERKLQIESRSMDENYMPDPEDVPSFVFLIDKTAQQAAQFAPKEPVISDEQFSIFDEGFEEADAAEEEAPAEAVDAVTEEETASADEPLSDVEETANALDAFLADFNVENGELTPTKAEEDAPPAEAVEEEAAPVVDAVPAEEDAPTEEAVPVEEVSPLEEAAPAEPRLKTNIFMLVLYIFLAIPIGLVGVALLLVPTVLFLALAAAFVYTGVSLIGMCFGNFAVIADTMVVFGAGLILAALSLLFVWLFIWFLGGVIFGFIRGICKLGRKLCCKEVAVQ